MLTADTSSRLGKLPIELIDAISGGNDGTMSRAEAEEYRLKVIDERTTFAQANDSTYFSNYIRPRGMRFFLSLIVSTTSNLEITEARRFSPYRQLTVPVCKAITKTHCIIVLVRFLERLRGSRDHGEESDDPSLTLSYSN